jgi:hypothetical protein
MGPEALLFPVWTPYTGGRIEREETHMACRAAQSQYYNATANPRQGELAMYGHALDRGRRGQLWAALTGRSRALLSLEEVCQASAVRARSSDGTRLVAVAHICGSESRAADFDCDFNPLQDQTRERWLGIAAARQRGRTLPPVALIRVGDRHFVRDGHHRISVARALGQTAIEATVEVWQVDSPLNCESLAQATRRSHARNHQGPRILAGRSGAASILGRLSGLVRQFGGAGAISLPR